MPRGNSRVASRGPYNQQNAPTPGSQQKEHTNSLAVLITTDLSTKPDKEQNIKMFADISRRSQAAVFSH
jgi:hypothetical protein